MFVSAGIPLYKMNNPNVKQFLEKYTGNIVPDESTFRKTYVEKTYNDTIEEIRKSIEDGPVWISVDETTDAERRYIANMIVGLLSCTEAKESFLLHCTEIPKSNHQTIAKTINEALSILWPDGIMYDSVYLLVTDNTAYMEKAGKYLSVLCTRMIHVTCVAHGLHRVAEAIRCHYSDVDFLINNVKKVFLKCPSRVQLFREKFPHISLPPDPVITRWGTWLEAAEYYSNNFQCISKIFEEFNESDSAAIQKVKFVLKSDTLFQNLLELKKDYVIIAHEIKKLESKNLTLESSISIIKDIVTKFTSSKTVHQFVKDKLANILTKNIGLKILGKLVQADINSLKNYPQLKSFNPSDIAKFKYAPIVSVDVERSFSKYKSLLADNRRSFKFSKAHYNLL